MTDPESIRCFLAATLSTDMLHKLEEAQRQLREKLAPLRIGLRWVSVENIHLTFKFFGQIAQATLPAIEERVGKVLRTEAPFSFEAATLGAFPSAKRPRVIWAGIREPEPARIGPLQDRLETALEELGFTREQRAFKPHLTLARIKPGDEQTSLSEPLQSFAEIKLGRTEVHELVLYKSELSRGGARYIPLKRVFFREPS
jgi:2'-5' RNA ligase